MNRRTSLVAVLATTALCLIAAATALAWGGAKWLPNTCGADLTAHAATGYWWVRVSDESGTIYENPQIPASKAYTADSPLTVGGFSRDTGFHQVKYEAGNAANHADGYVSYTQRQANCGALAGRPGPQGAPGPPGQNGVGYDCAGVAMTGGATPAVCPGTPGKVGPPGPAAQTCTSNRVYRVKVGDQYRGSRINSARLSWANGKRHTNAVRRHDGRLHAVVSFRRIVSPLRGLWTIRLNISFDGGKHATLTRLVRLCAPDDSNLNFATDVHRDGV